MEKTMRLYGRTELAQLYCPELTPDAAWRKLKRWITGYAPSQRSFTPKMVEHIFYYLGEP